MRVCLISREYPPDTGFGGIATFAKHLSMGLVDLGHEVEVVSLCRDKPGINEIDGIRVHRVSVDGITEGLHLLSAYMPYSKYVLGTSTALWKKFIELHESKPFDVVDTPELLAEGLMPAISKAAPLLIRLYTPHSKFIQEGLHNVTPSFDHQFVAGLERVAMLSADMITSPSDDLAQFVSNDLDYPLEKIQIVRNPVDATAFSPEGPRKRPPDIADGTLNILFVGRLEERKGIKYLIEALPKVVREFASVHLTVIGDDTNNAAGQKSVLAELKDSISFYGLQSSITFINRIPLTELPSYYRGADICIVPSVYDNSPYTCLEAMSCGRPVIGTSAGGTCEYIVDGESGIIIEPRSSDAIAGALLALLENDSARQQLGRNARARVLAKFQRREIARQTVALYEEACRRYVDSHKFSLYLKNKNTLFDDARYFLGSFETMLHDELYRWSYRYRLRHWGNQIVSRPRLFAARVLLRASKSALAAAGYGKAGKNYPEIIAKLESSIALKSRPIQTESDQDDNQSSETTLSGRICRTTDKKLVTARSARNIDRTEIP